VTVAISGARVRRRLQLGGAAGVGGAQCRPGQGIGGVVLRVVASADQRQLAVGVSDDRGEALVAVPGVPITTWAATADR
jgi:hypothetical protein